MIQNSSQQEAPCNLKNWKEACKKGDVKTLNKWMNHPEVTVTWLIMGGQEARKHEQWEAFSVVMWSKKAWIKEKECWTEKTEQIQETEKENAWIEACQDGQHEWLKKWIEASQKTVQPRGMRQVKLPGFNGMSFGMFWACKKGNQKVVEVIWETAEKILSSDTSSESIMDVGDWRANNIFRAMEGSYFDLAQWIMSKSKISPQVMDDFCQKRLDIGLGLHLKEAQAWLDYRQSCKELQQLQEQLQDQIQEKDPLQMTASDHENITGPTKSGIRAKIKRL